MRHLAFSILATAMISAGANASIRIVPAKGESLVFERTYPARFLKSEHPLQRVEKTRFKLSNSGGHLIGTWTATFRDLRTDKKTEGEAVSLCRRRSSRRVECMFSIDAGSVEILSDRDHVLLSVPLTQGVTFVKKDEIGKPAKTAEAKPASLSVPPNPYESIEGQETPTAEAPPDAEEEGPWREFLMGEDVDNNLFKVFPKTARR